MRPVALALALATTSAAPATASDEPNTRSSKEPTIDATAPARAPSSEGHTIGAAAPAEARARASEGPTVDTMRAAFLRGELWAAESERARLGESGADVTHGALGLVDDLSRLVRCLPLGPVPSDETPDYAAIRALARLERMRLEMLLRDGAFAGSPLADLLLTPALYTTASPTDADAWIRWPRETEVWPGEALEAAVEAQACPERPGARREGDPGAHTRRAQLRRARALSALAGLVGQLEFLPPAAAGRVAYAYVVEASARVQFRVPLRWSKRLSTALGRAEPRFAVAGLLALGQIHERAQEEDRAKEVYRQLESRAHEATDEQDGLLRVRLARLEEPDFPRVLAIVRRARDPRPNDEVALAHAEARALYAGSSTTTGARLPALMRFGRRWLQTPRGDGPVEEATREILVRVGLELEPAAALAWIAELGDPSRRNARIHQLGQLAMENGRLELATSLYDQLRFQAATERKQRGAPATAELARWSAERARIEFARGEAATFAGFLEALLELAREESDQPLARFAPQREVLRLTQDLVGRIANRVAGEPELRKFAALLLDAATRLAETKSRWQRPLEDQLPTLVELAGPHAHRRPSAVAAGSTRAKGKAPRRVRHLGEVLIARLPPHIDIRSEPTALPEVDTFLVYEKPGGTRETGSPWAALAEARRAKASAGREKR